jgi:hypothetical protein
MDLFIVHSSGEAVQDLSGTARPFAKVLGSVHYVDKVGDIGGIIAKGSDRNPIPAWYGVFYDNETVNIGISEALPIYLKNGKFKVLCMMKKEANGSFSKCPRVFDQEVILSPNSLVPDETQENLEFETMLDGWVMPL